MRTFDGCKTLDYAHAMEITGSVVEKEGDDIHKAFQKYVLMHLNILMVGEIFNCLNPQKYSEKILKMKDVVMIRVFQKAIASIGVLECRNIRMLPVIFSKLKWYGCASLLFIISARINYNRTYRNINS